VVGERQLVLVDIRSDERARIFGSRWAVSYLCGPVTLAELGPLVAATLPDLTDDPPEGARFPRAAPAGLAATLDDAERDLVAWRARRPVPVLAHSKLEAAAGTDESEEAFRLRCLEAADRADDARQEAVRTRFAKCVDTVERRLEREQDEVDRIVAESGALAARVETVDIRLTRSQVDVVKLRLVWR
jgi:hypothetical protein